jgi:hypothetical protein
MIQPFTRHQIFTGGSGHYFFHGVDVESLLGEAKVSSLQTRIDADQPNTKRNHANDPLEVPIGPITRARAKKLKEALNGLVQNIWSKMDLEGLRTFKEHEGQPLIHLVQVQEEPNSCGTKIDVSGSIPALLGLFS